MHHARTKYSVPQEFNVKCWVPLLLLVGKSIRLKQFSLGSQKHDLAIYASRPSSTATASLPPYLSKLYRTNIRGYQQFTTFAFTVNIINIKMKVHILFFHYITKTCPKIYLCTTYLRIDDCILYYLHTSYIFMIIQILWIIEKYVNLRNLKDY